MRRARALNLASRCPAIHSWGTGDCFKSGARFSCAPTDQSIKAREMDLRHGFREERSGGGGLPSNTPWASHSFKKFSQDAERHWTTHSASFARRAARSSSCSRPGLALTNMAPFQRGDGPKRPAWPTCPQGIAADEGMTILGGYFGTKHAPHILQAFGAAFQIPPEVQGASLHSSGTKKIHDGFPIRRRTQIAVQKPKHGRNRLSI